MCPTVSHSISDMIPAPFAKFNVLCPTVSDSIAGTIPAVFAITTIDLTYGALYLSLSRPTVMDAHQR